MSAGARTGHIKAAEALELSFAADVRVAEVITNDALQYTNKLFRDFYSGFAGLKPGRSKSLLYPVSF